MLVPMSSDRLDLLKNMPVFGGLSDSALGWILEFARSVDVAAGEYFFRQGDDSHTTFVLESGRVSVLKSWEEVPQRLRSLGVGDCFGEMALIDFGARSASVVADEDCRAIEFSPACLLEVAKRDLEQYALVYMNMARELSRRLRLADERLFEAQARDRAGASDPRGDAEFTFNST